MKPFDEEKYRALLDGLECNEIRLADLYSAGRLDAEYFKKELVNEEERVKDLTHFYLPLENVVSGPFGSSLKSESYLEKGPVPFIRIGNILGGFWINTNDLVYISEENNKKISNSELKPDDLILSKVGNSIGYFARVNEKMPRCNISENNIGIRLQQYNVPERHFILTYFNCKYGRRLIRRRQSGNGQPKINVSDVAKIPIPSFSDKFYEQISIVIKMAGDCIDRGNSEYREAEELLLRNIDISKLSLSSDNISVKSFSESFGNTGRLDAEYYQKKYDELLASVQKEAYGELRDIVEISKSIEPGSEAYCDEGIPFIRISDFSKYGLSVPDKYLEPGSDYDIPALYLKKDEILFSKDGSIGIAYKVERDTKAITSGALLHLEIKDSVEILPDYLTAILNSDIVKLQAERDAGGSIINHWKPSEIEKVQIPILPIDEQQDISDRIIHSFSLRHKSERLLDAAKQAVEIAIEQSEEAAITWLNNTISEIEASTK